MLLAAPSPWKTIPVYVVALAGLQVNVTVVAAAFQQAAGAPVASGLIARTPDPGDGRAALLSLTEQGTAVLEAVSESRRQVLAQAIAEWTDEERNALASGLLRLGAGLHHLRDAPDVTTTDLHEGNR